MPHINVKLYPGKSDEMKEKLAEAVRTALAETSGVWKPGDILIDSDYINFK